MWDFVAALLCIFFGGCEEGACRTLSHKGADHTVCSYQVDKISVQMFLNDAGGRPHAQIGRLSRSFAGQNRQPLMLMNGGMYHDDLGPVGLYIENQKQRKALSTKKGWGNFHLLPNGVFWFSKGRAGVTESKRYARTVARRKIKPDFATQSGPMLVINGKLHPRFIRNSNSLKIRNGVGISRDGKTLHFAISHGVVNFWDFGDLFRTRLKAHNALFLDGSVSAIRAGRISRGGWRDLGPMIGVFEREPKTAKKSKAKASQ